MKLIPTPDDDRWLRMQPRELDPQVWQRILMERAVIRQACNDLVAAGFALRIWNGESYNHDGATQDVDVVMDNLMAADEEVLHVYKRSDAGHWIAHGTVVLVYGNDGWDVIADNSIAMEPHLAGASALADKLCEDA